MSALDGLIVSGMILQNAGQECFRLRRESRLQNLFHTNSKYLVRKGMVASRSSERVNTRMVLKPGRTLKL